MSGHRPWPRRRWREDFWRLDAVMQDGGSLNDPMPEETGPRWLVGVRAGGRELWQTVFCPGPGEALTRGIMSVLSHYPDGTEHEGAWAYFYHDDESRYGGESDDGGELTGKETDDKP